MQLNRMSSTVTRVLRVQEMTKNSWKFIKNICISLMLWKGEQHHLDYRSLNTVRPYSHLWYNCLE